MTFWQETFGARVRRRAVEHAMNAHDLSERARGLIGQQRGRGPCRSDSLRRPIAIHVVLD